MFRYGYLILVLLLFVLRRYGLDNDPHKCQALLSSGHWLSNRWHASSCSTVDYGGNSLNTCAQGRRRRIVFAGDLQLQGTYYHFVQRLTTSKNLEVPPFVEQDLYHEAGSVSVLFLYDPYINGSSLEEVIQAYKGGGAERPMLTVIGAGNHAVRTASTQDYLASVKSLASIAYSEPNRRPLSSSVEYHDGPGDLLLFAPAEEPADPRAVDSKDLNRRLQALAENSSIHTVPAFTRMTAGYPRSLNGSDLVTETVFRARAELLLNLRCNAILAGKGLGNDLITCCASGRSPSWVQVSFMLLTASMVLAVMLLIARTRSSNTSDRPVLCAATTFCAVILVSYTTDRSHLPEHSRKQAFAWVIWGCLTLVSFVIGAATIRRCALASKTTEAHQHNERFLPRDQSNEWKGWMQLMIIIYHYGLEAPLPVWQFIRICVSSYLFLTGFGHTLYFLQKKDYSMKRFVNIMIRLNLLTVTLAFVMRTYWISYYYLPLCTMWFLIIYATLAIGRKHNSTTPLLLGKIVMSSLLLDRFFATNGARETLVYFFTSITRGSFPVNFFDRRMINDRYIVYIGMASAPLYLWLTATITDTSQLPQDTLSVLVRKHWTSIKRFSILLAILALITFCYTCTHLSKSQFSSYQAYINWIPIFSFMVLRNSTPTLRNFHSAAFAWLGRYSGEIYIMHFHIWLAGNQGMVLRTGFFHGGDETFWGDRWRDMVILTPLLLICCQIVGDATSVLADWFVRDWRTSLQGSRGEDDDNRFDLDEVKGEGPSRLIIKLSWSRRVVSWPVRRLEGRVVVVLLVLWALNLTYS